MKNKKSITEAKNGLKFKAKTISERVAGLYKSGDTNNFFTTIDFQLSGITQAEMLKFIKDKGIAVGGDIGRGMIILSKDSKILTRSGILSL